MKKILTTFLLIMLSLTIISCGTKKDVKTEDQTKKVDTQEKIDTTKNNKPIENKKDDDLKKIDELISGKLKESKIEANVKTTNEQGTILTVLNVTNNEELNKGDANPIDSHTLNVLINNYIILGAVVSSEVNGTLPESIAITTKSKNVEGDLTMVIVTKDVAKIFGNDTITRIQSMISLSVIDCNNANVKDSIKFIKEYEK